MSDQAASVNASITMIGEDRKGVVAQVTQALFEAEANIESLEEHVTRGRFHMNLLASWPPEAVGEGRQERLKGTIQALGANLGMETRVRFHRGDRQQRMAILVTKEPHCLERLIEAHEEGELEAVPAVVIGNHDNHLREIAEDAGLPYHHVPWSRAEAAEAALLDLLDRYEVDFLVLARFMRILSPGFCYRFRNRILNIHPSLLPAFPGASAYRQAWERGVRVVGVTAHFVTPDLDQGPIISQDAFRVDFEADVGEITERGQELEAEVLLEAVKTYLEKDLDVHWGRVWSA
ncbi:MAG: formyltetrahydrofolate deformylase [Candidatus Thermoplasmatota archaeon]|nr:formyltetrahydrofolate deformylase [Candidatus Thermoplasmatota archaeon]